MKKSLFIGIAGGSGSGKTTLANKLADYFGERLSLLRHDDYYKSQSSLTLEERAVLNFDHPDAFDTPLLIKHLDELSCGRSISCPIYDYSKHDRSDEVREVNATEVIVLEGILIFENPEILNRLDIKILASSAILNNIGTISLYSFESSLSPCKIFVTFLYVIRYAERITPL